MESKKPNQPSVISGQFSASPARAIQEHIPMALRHVRLGLEESRDNFERLTFLQLFLNVAELLDSGDVLGNQVSPNFYESEN
ncbi:MAG: hypothetical protein HY774_26910 [Acidobacteria bacterium]|nr:hypothetical protein [Acidobacteriota bacterium]